jgi:hypothetical protein
MDNRRDQCNLRKQRYYSNPARGWRAAAPGSQTIRLVFDQPQRCISLVFEENETARTQEFVLRWSPDSGSSVEEYQVQLSGVTVLELIINPNVGGGAARASLKNLRLS